MKEEVQDRFSLVWCIFVLLGTGTLLPFNVFLTEKEFYDVRFQVAPYNPFIVNTFMSLFCLIFNTANLIALALLIHYQKFLSVRVLVLQPFIITLLMLGSAAALAVKTEVDGDVMAEFTLPTLAIMGICTALLQGGTLQLASLFSMTHIRGVVSGISIGGVATSVLSFVSQFSATSSSSEPSPEDVAPSAFIYFSASAMVIVACIAGYWSLFLLPYGRYRFRLAGILTEPLDSKLGGDYEEPLIVSIAPARDAASGSQQRAGGPTRASIIRVESMRPPTEESVPWSKRHGFTLYCTALFICFVVTMAIHPSITSFICSIHNPAVVSPCTARPDGYSRLYGDLFVPLLYVVFNVGDFLGRMLAGFGPWGRAPPNGIAVVIYAILRGALAALLLFANVIAPTPWKLPVLLGGDEYSLGVVALLGLTQGHMISTVLMHAPSTLPSDKQARFGPVTSFAISFGSFLGSFASFACVYFLQTHQSPSSYPPPFGPASSAF